MGCGSGASGFPVAQGCHLRDGVVDPADPHVARVQAKGLAGVVRAVQRPAPAGWRAEAPAWRRSATGYRRLITLCERGALPRCGASAPGRIDRQEPR